MGMSKMAPRSKPEFCVIAIGMSGVELSEAMSSIWPRAHEGAKGNWFGGNAGEDVKGMSRNNVREVGDHGNAVPGVGSLVGRSVNGWGSKRKSRGSFRM
jgi:hypothetical protein